MRFFHILLTLLATSSSRKKLGITQATLIHMIDIKKTFNTYAYVRQALVDTCTVHWSILCSIKLFNTNMKRILSSCFWKLVTSINHQGTKTKKKERKGKKKTTMEGSKCSCSSLTTGTSAAIYDQTDDTESENVYTLATS